MLRVYDCTAERWLDEPHSGTTPDSGAAADLRFTKQSRNTLSVASPVVPHATGHLREAVIDAATTVLGLLVFGLIAGFFLVLA